MPSDFRTSTMKSDPVRCAVRTSTREGSPASASRDIRGTAFGGSLAGGPTAAPAVETSVATLPAAALFRKLRRPREVGLARAIRGLSEYLRQQGSVALQDGKETVDHLLRRDPCRVHPNVHRRDHFPHAVMYRHRDGAQTELQFLIHQGVTIAPGALDDGGQRAFVGHRRRSQSFELDSLQIRSQLRARYSGK